MKNLLSIAAALAMFVSTQAFAVTDGELDGEGHPAVGLLIFDFAPGAPGWRCSGTLISPTVILTAGHCTDGAVGGRVCQVPQVLTHHRLIIIADANRRFKVAPQRQHRFG